MGKFMGNTIFSIMFQQMYEHAIRVFSGLQYVIMLYMAIERKNGEPVKIVVDGKEKCKTKAVPEKLHKFGNHGYRHMRATELRNRYGIKGIDLDVYVGWVSDRRETGGRTQDRYTEQSWRTYLPKLLRKKN